MRSLAILGICSGIALLVCGYAVMSDDGLPKTKKLSAERDALEHRIADIEAENSALAHEIENLRDEDDVSKHPFLEQAVRKELGYIKKDEIVVLTKPAVSASN